MKTTVISICLAFLATAAIAEPDKQKEACNKGWQLIAKWESGTLLNAKDKTSARKLGGEDAIELLKTENEMKKLREILSSSC